jgi:hypothetical protein
MVFLGNFMVASAAESQGQPPPVTLGDAPRTSVEHSCARAVHAGGYPGRTTDIGLDATWGPRPEAKPAAVRSRARAVPRGRDGGEWRALPW